MKKLTAGIFATLLAVVSTGAANAEIASKGYVDDQVGTVSTQVDSLSTTVDQHTSQIGTINTTIGRYGDIVTHNVNEFATAAQGTKADTAVQPAAISDMQVKANLTTNAEWATEKTSDDKYPSNAAVDAAITSATSKLPTSGAITEIKDDITEIKGNVTQLQTSKQDADTAVEVSAAGTAVGSTTQPVYVNESGVVTPTNALGSLAWESTITSADITDGTIAEGDLNESINASLDKADTALQKTTADAAYAVKSTETTASTAASNAQKALTDIGTKSELTTTHKDNLVGAINELDAAMDDMATNETIQGIQTDLTELEGKVDTNTTNIETNTTHIGTVGSLSTNTKTDLVSAVNEVKTQADKGVSDAAAAKSTADTAKSTADSALTKANAAIPAPDGECAKPANKCVLTYNNTVYAWEVIERGTSESSN